MSVNCLTDKLIIMNFPPYSGGKFLANCLALSKNAVVQDRFVADFDCQLKSIDDFQLRQYEWHSTLIEIYEFIDQYGWQAYCEHCNENTDALTIMRLIDNEAYPFTSYFKYRLEYLFSCFPFTDYYDFKLKAVMGTLPKVNEEVKHWTRYELGCYQLSGTISSPDIDYQNNFSVQMENITNSDKNFFLVDHSPNARFLREKWPNAKVLRLTNYIKFQELASELKSASNRGKPWREVDNNYDYEFDVDSTYFDERNFLIGIENLYNQLGYDDFNEDLVRKFYRAYADIHGC